MKPADVKQVLFVEKTRPHDFPLYKTSQLLQKMLSLVETSSISISCIPKRNKYVKCFIHTKYCHTCFGHNAIVK